MSCRLQCQSNIVQSKKKKNHKTRSSVIKTFFNPFVRPDANKRCNFIFFIIILAIIAVVFIGSLRKIFSRLLTLLCSVFFCGWFYLFFQHALHSKRASEIWLSCFFIGLLTQIQLCVLLCTRRGSLSYEGPQQT